MRQVAGKSKKKTEERERRRRKRRRNDLLTLTIVLVFVFVFYVSEQLSKEKKNPNHHLLSDQRKEAFTLCLFLLLFLFNHFCLRQLQVLPPPRSHTSRSCVSSSMRSLIFSYSLFLLVFHLWSKYAGPLFFFLQKKKKKR